VKTYQEGGWTFTTPIYIGATADIEKAAKCLHPKFSELTRAVCEGMVLVDERCDVCVAARVRYRPAKDGER